MAMIIPYATAGEVTHKRNLPIAKPNPEQANAKGLRIKQPMRLVCPVCGGKRMTLEGTKAHTSGGAKGACFSYTLLFGCEKCHDRKIDYPDEAKFRLVFDLGGGQTLVNWEVTPTIMGLIALEQNP